MLKLTSKVDDCLGKNGKVNSPPYDQGAGVYFGCVLFQSAVVATVVVTGKENLTPLFSVRRGTVSKELPPNLQEDSVQTFSSICSRLHSSL